MALALYKNLNQGLCIVRSGVNAGELGFRPRFVGVEEILKDFWNEDGTLFSAPRLAGLYPAQVALALRAAHRQANVIRVFTP